MWRKTHLSVLWHLLWPLLFRAESLHILGLLIDFVLVLVGDCIKYTLTLKLFRLWSMDSAFGFRKTHTVIVLNYWSIANLAFSERCSKDVFVFTMINAFYGKDSGQKGGDLCFYTPKDTFLFGVNFHYLLYAISTHTQ